jgi:ABC-2 type transport system permease protein
MARKELIQILRDPRTLAIAVLMPPLFMLMFGYGVDLDTSAIPVCVLDREGSQQSQDLLKRFQASRYFGVVAVMDNYRSVLQALDQERCTMAIVVPPDFSKQLAIGGPVRVQTLVDAIDDNTANMAFSYGESVLRAFNASVQLEWQRRNGFAPIPSPLYVQSRTWFNEDLESRAFIVPGVIGLVMTVIGTLLTSLTVAREWERGTMEQLIATPIHISEIMIGKLAPYFAISVVDAGICTALAVWGFHVPFRGSWAALLLSSLLFLVVVLAMGYWISAATKAQLPASQAALVGSFLPALLLSGFIFPIDQMPLVMRGLTRIIPARYYISLLKALFLRGTAVPLLWSDLLALLAFALVMGVVATRALHKTLD